MKKLVVCALLSAGFVLPGLAIAKNGTKPTSKIVAKRRISVPSPEILLSIASNSSGAALKFYVKNAPKGAKLAVKYGNVYESIPLSGSKQLPQGVVRFILTDASAKNILTTKEVSIIKPSKYTTLSNFALNSKTVESLQGQTTVQVDTLNYGNEFLFNAEIQTLDGKVIDSVSSNNLSKKQFTIKNQNGGEYKVVSSISGPSGEGKKEDILYFYVLPKAQEKVSITPTPVPTIVPTVQPTATPTPVKTPTPSKIIPTTPPKEAVTTATLGLAGDVFFAGRSPITGYTPDLFYGSAGLGAEIKSFDDIFRMRILPLGARLSKNGIGMNMSGIMDIQTPIGLGLAYRGDFFPIDNIDWKWTSEHIGKLTFTYNILEIGVQGRLIPVNGNNYEGGIGPMIGLKFSERSFGQVNIYGGWHPIGNSEQSLYLNANIVLAPSGASLPIVQTKN